MSADITGYRGRVIERQAAVAPIGVESHFAQGAGGAGDQPSHEHERDRILAEARAAASAHRIQALEQTKVMCAQLISDEFEQFSAAVRQDLEDISPQLTALVMDAVEAIIGMVPEQDVAAALIREGIDRFDQDAVLLVRSNTIHAAMTHEIVDAINAEREGPAVAVVFDRRITEDAHVITDGRLSLEMNVGGRVDQLRQNLQTAEGQNEFDAEGFTEALLKAKAAAINSNQANVDGLFRGPFGI